MLACPSKGPQGRDEIARRKELKMEPKEPRLLILDAAAAQEAENLSDEQVAGEMKVSLSAWRGWKAEAQDARYPMKKWQRRTLTALREFVERHEKSSTKPLDSVG